jgi:hypothetical protein
MRPWKYCNRYYYERVIPDIIHLTFTMHYVRSILIKSDCNMENCEACKYVKSQMEKGHRIYNYIPNPFRL